MGYCNIRKKKNGVGRIRDGIRLSHSERGKLAEVTYTIMA